MKLIDLAFINKFANSQTNKDKKDIFKLQYGPLFGGWARPTVGDYYISNGSAHIREIGLDAETILVTGDSFNWVASGAYMVWNTNDTKQYGYICSFEYDSEENKLIYKTVTPWDGKIDKLDEEEWEGYFSCTYGCIMPDLNTYKEDDTDDVIYISQTLVKPNIDILVFSRIAPE